MIEKMKKLTLLLYHAEKEQFLEKLRKLGVVHVVEDEAAASDELTSVREELRSVERVASGLKRIGSTLKEPVTQKPADDVSAVVAEYEKLVGEKDRAQQAIASAKKDIGILEPWGDFSPAHIARLAEHGVTIRFFETTAKKHAATDYGNAAYEVVGEAQGRVRLVHVSTDGRVEVDADGVTLPDCSLSEANERCAEEEKKLAGVEEQLVAMCRYTDALQRAADVLGSSEQFEMARLSMEDGAEGRVLSLSGWLPAKVEAKVKALLDSQTSWYAIEEPAAGEDIPVKLSNPTAVKIFEPITEFFALPDYFELDPTPFFAPFFALFFGLCLGDLGYGLVLTAAALGVLFSIGRKSTQIRFLGLLVLAFGVMACITGLFLNTFFGHAIFATPGFEGAYFQQGARVALFAPVESETGTYFPAMPFAVYLGVFQMLVGMTLRTVNNVRNNGWLFVFGPLAQMLMMGAAVIALTRGNFIDLRTFQLGTFPMGEAIATLPAKLEMYLGATGLGMLLLLGRPKAGVVGRLGGGLWDLYQFATGFMGDGLSYLRLFALGLAGGMLGAAFNDIAFMFITNADGEVNYASFGIIGTILVLILGHTINFALALLGSFVHSMRLTFVEFYRNLDFTGGGIRYRPLSAPGRNA